MRIVLQRVSQASVSVDGEIVGKIGKGLVVLLGIDKKDNEAEIEWASKKTAELRIFQDEDGKLNLNLLEVSGEALVISQFTLLGDARKGRRPSYTDAADPDIAQPLYEYFVKCLREIGVKTETGVFAAKMSVSLINEGPVTLIVER